MRSMKWSAKLGAVWMAGSLAASCGPDLGQCDMAALGGSTIPPALSPHTGQILIDQKCASGRCHSERAAGAARVGAPADLDFDVVPTDSSPAALSLVGRGGANVDDYAEAMWEEIEEGAMPPAGQGRAAPTAAEKEAIRNWLACGAEVVPAPLSVGPGADPWTRFYTEVSGECMGCHAGGSLMGPWMAMDACSSYAAVVGVAGSTPACTSTQLVVAGNPDASSLLTKLEGGVALCGGLMPLGATTPYAALDATRAARVQALRAWIASGAPKPPLCP